MWIDSFRQFLNRSFQRFADWLHAIELRARWRSAPLEASLPALEGFGPSKVQFDIDAQHGNWRADLTYRYRSLHCLVQVSLFEPTPGMQHIYRALPRPDEA
jgi:hypothetical protein